MRHATRDIIPHRTQGVPLPPEDRARLASLIAREGEPAALLVLQIARQTLARCAAGLPVQRATAECVSRRLADIEAADAK